ncbi:hypothetical protein [Mycobacterium sp.]|uniref:hypothetical protein n=1 Tax=Mycobacterium sp. TaxID=1785 RepID=UPI003D0C6751
MSNKSRYHRTADGRRRRGVTGSGLGIAVGGAMAAAFISMGTASADVADTEPDPFTDLLGANASATDLATAQAADMTFVTTSHTDVATLLDNTYDVYSTLPAVAGDVDPFEDLLPANATALQLAEALNGDISSSVSVETNIEAGIDSGATAPVSATDTEPDPFTDLLGPNATAAELGQASAADASLAAQDPTAALNDDQLFDGSLIPPGDNDPFEDLLPANAPTTQVALAILLDNKLYTNDPTLNPNNIPTLTGNLDAQVDSAQPPPDTEPDPFLDSLTPLQSSDPSIVSLATVNDTALATANPTLAGQFDSAIDAGLPAGDPTDADAFSDAGLTNGTTLDATYPTLAAQLDPTVDGMVTPPVDTEPDPFLDSLPATASATQMAQATAADTALATANPTLAGQFDSAVDAGLPAGDPTDADAFSDAGLTNGTTLDAEFPTLAAQLDPGVDVVPPTDADAFTDLAQAFDPNAFTAAAVPSDFIGTLAAGLDTLFAPGGFDASLDPLADSIITAFGVHGMF